jgi:hypothetical protein
MRGLRGEAFRQRIETLSTPDAATPGTGLEHEADIALDEVASSEHCARIVEAENGAVEVVGVPPQSAGTR